MKINVEKLKSCTGSVQAVALEERIIADDYGYQGVSLSAPVLFQGSVKNEKSILVVEGHVSGKIEAVCSRCLTTFPYEIETVFSERYTNHEEIAAADEEDEIHFFQGDELDITEDVLRQIFLSLPMKFVCKEDCQGFCPHCGINLNTGTCHCADDQIDPRWEKLKILLDCNKKEG
ncbi:MAG: DUF177 domain-containing protein [Peptococcaceae bacterium]|nr:DUF177 domain-containing protein [Peptococcaceae bacterium]